MGIDYAVVAMNTSGTSITDLANDGYLEFRVGTKGSDGAVLATLRFSSPAFSAFINGRASVNSVTSDTNIARSGRAGWFRVYSKNMVPLFDGTVSKAGGGGDIILDKVDFIAGGIVSIIGGGVSF